MGSKYGRNRKHEGIEVVRDAGGGPSSAPRFPAFEPVRFTSSTAFAMSSVPNAFSQSSFFATRPFDTFVKTCSICRTSDRSVSLVSKEPGHIEVSDKVIKTVIGPEEGYYTAILRRRAEQGRINEVINSVGKAKATMLTRLF